MPSAKPKIQIKPTAEKTVHLCCIKPFTLLRSRIYRRLYARYRNFGCLSLSRVMSICSLSSIGPNFLSLLRFSWANLKCRPKERIVIRKLSAQPVAQPLTKYGLEIVSKTSQPQGRKSTYPSVLGNRVLLMKELHWPRIASIASPMPRFVSPP
jgi:hypothetical protein